MKKNNILLEKYSDLILEKTASEKGKSANENSTHRSNVNEYLLAHELGVLAGHHKGGQINRATGLSTRPGFTESDKVAAEKKYLTSKKKLSSEEFNHQWERAKEMAKTAHKTFLNRPDEHGGSLDLKKATQFAVSAGADAIAKLTGDTSIDSKENTSDVIGRLPGKKGNPDVFPGVSAKSNVGSTEEGGERFSNRAVTGIADNLEMPHLHKDVADSMQDFAAKHNLDHLPMSSKTGEGGRKENIRKNQKIADEAEYFGSENKKDVRNKIHDWVNKNGSNPSNPEGVNKVRRHLLDHHFREAGSSHPTVPFITVSGHGTTHDKNSSKRYGAHGHFSYENPRVQLLNSATHISALHAGDYGTHIFAHTKEHPEGVHVMKLDSKWNSQPMASSMKVVGTEGDTRKRRTDFEKKQAAAAARASTPVKNKKAPVKKRIVEGYEFSGDDAFEMLTLGTGMDEIDLNENHKNYLKDSKGNVRIFIIRGAAAKEAHTKGGTVVPYGRGYAVLLEEKQHDYHVFEKFIRSESGHNGGQKTSSGSTVLTESACGGGDSCSCGCGGKESEQSNAKRKGTLTFKEITERKHGKTKINEAKDDDKTQVMLSESIDKGIEPGLSMATSGENMLRGSIKNKPLKKPFEEMTGDETGASIGDQKEDELKKKGISLTSFKKRNYI